MVMRDEYDFSQAGPNPHAERLRSQSTSTPSTRSGSGARFEIYRDRTEHYRWRLVDADGQTVSVSAVPFETLDDCRVAVERTRSLASEARVGPSAA